jgi:hypothetical protein
LDKIRFYPSTFHSTIVAIHDIGAGFSIGFFSSCLPLLFLHSHSHCLNLCSFLALPVRDSHHSWPDSRDAVMATNPSRQADSKQPPDQNPAKISEFLP